MNPKHRFAAVFAAAALSFSVAQAQVVLKPQNAVAFDTSFASASGTDLALIDFINQTSFAVDIYWIDYSGNRVYYNTLAPFDSYYQSTYQTHPWIAAVYGSGDTEAQGTGKLLEGFTAVTTNVDQVGALADLAYITDSPVAAVPEPGSWALLLAGIAALVSVPACRRGRAIRA